MLIDTEPQWRKTVRSAGESLRKTFKHTPSEMKAILKTTVAEVPIIDKAIDRTKEGILDAAEAVGDRSRAALASAGEKAAAQASATAKGTLGMAKATAKAPLKMAKAGIGFTKGTLIAATAIGGGMALASAFNRGGKPSVTAKSLEEAANAAATDTAPEVLRAEELALPPLGLNAAMGGDGAALLGGRPTPAAKMAAASRPAGFAGKIAAEAAEVAGHVRA